MEAASSNKGFFQKQPVLKNQVYDDVSYQRVLKLFVPDELQKKLESEITQLGEDVIAPQIFNYITDAERNLPYLRGSGRDAFGRPASELVTSEGWRKLQEFGFEHGIVAYNYDTDHAQYSRLVQMLRLHLWEASCASTTCPGAMQDGATRLLQRHLHKGSTLDPTLRRVLQNAYDRLTSRDPTRAWTSGQWMTERPGGSDVSQTETVATHAPFPAGQPAPLASPEEGIPLGPWEINGFKWFSSATDSGMTILLARTAKGGLSAFYAPMRRHNPSLVSLTGARTGGQELNGVRIQRLKDKSGTKAVPTAELELSGMRGWLIGEEGKGIQEISTILTVTRVHCSVHVMGNIGRGLAIAKAYALVREVGSGKGKRLRLCRSPLHMRTLADMTLDYHAMMLLTFFTISVMGLDESASIGRERATPARSGLTPPPELVSPLLRVLSSLHKGYCCKQGIPLLYACMESLGGVGYLNNSETEPLNVARLFRDASVNATWEGTTDVLSTDTLRALKHPASGKKCIMALDWLVSSALAKNDGAAEREIRRSWAEVRERLQTETQDDLLPEARDIMFKIAEVLMATLLIVDARSDGSKELGIMCRRFMVKKGLTAGKYAALKGEDGLDLDTRIVYGPRGLPKESDVKL
ncbi:uncharacterized protein E0L32_011878 [Thyridium curvatum]|uniref:Acyl-CoA dehydrogenase n=1 Tax=Thyridium curvatum TaxID=1093900 RepID=A0A507BKQ6_9PEZI|nr:uncharacterized protein E0L32_011878 [Thyridium curvatum]TPX18059.1 hypothetical protein E0L32_011878 [Thyridium curvatum]